MPPTLCQHALGAPPRSRAGQRPPLSARRRCTCCCWRIRRERTSPRPSRKISSLCSPRACPCCKKCSPCQRCRACRWGSCRVEGSGGLVSSAGGGSRHCVHCVLGTAAGCATMRFRVSLSKKWLATKTPRLTFLLPTLPPFAAGLRLAHTRSGLHRAHAVHCAGGPDRAGKIDWKEWLAGQEGWLIGLEGMVGCASRGTCLPRLLPVDRQQAVLKTPRKRPPPLSPAHASRPSCSGVVESLDHRTPQP